MASGAGTTIAHGHGHVVKVYDDERDFAVERRGVRRCRHRRRRPRRSSWRRRVIGARIDGCGPGERRRPVRRDRGRAARRARRPGVVGHVHGRWDTRPGPVRRGLRAARARPARLAGCGSSVRWSPCCGTTGTSAPRSPWNSSGTISVGTFRSRCTARTRCPLFGRAGDLGAIRDVCDHHAEVVGPRDDAGDDRGRIATRPTRSRCRSSSCPCRSPSGPPGDWSSTPCGRGATRRCSTTRSSSRPSWRRTPSCTPRRRSGSR